MSAKKKYFTFENKKYSVITPTGEHERDSKKYFNLAFKNALQNGALLRVTLDQYMKDQGIWNDDMQKKFVKYNTILVDNVKAIRKGKMSVFKGRELALQASDARAELVELLSVKDKLDAITADAQAEQERMNYLVSVCTYNEDGEKVFSSYDDFMKKSTEPFGQKCAAEFMFHYSGLDENFEKNMPEVQFLLKYGFLKEENGTFRYTDRQGNYVDKDGNPLDLSVETKDGEEEESGPFLEEDGTEITFAETKTESETENKEESVKVEESNK